MKVLNVVFLILILPFSVYAKISLKDFEYFPGKETGKIKIRFNGELGKEPLFTVKKNLLQVEIFDSTVWPRIEKRVSVGNPGFDTKMMMYQYDKDTVRFRVLFPFPTAELEKKFKLKRLGKYIILEFPNRKIPTKVVKKEVNKLDEEYLKNLLTETKPVEKTDEVKMGLSAIKKAGNEFSLTTIYR